MKYPDDFINKIICGDCIEIMKYIPDKSIDLILTDPPYNAGIEYDNYKDNLTDEEYKFFIYKFMKEFLRISKRTIIFVGIGNLFKYPEPEMVLIWLKRNGYSRSGYVIHNCYEPIVCYGKLKSIFTDVYDYPIVFQKDKIEHPTPKPLRLIEKLIVDFSKEGDVVLDPFVGSGTTAVAAKKLKRKYIGIDISEKYCEVAKKRLETEVDNLLF